MVKATKKSFSKKSRTMRRKSGKKMGGRRQNKSLKTHHKKGMKKMCGGAKVTTDLNGVPGIHLNEDGKLIAELGTYPDGEEPTFEPLTDEYVSISIQLPEYDMDGSHFNALKTNFVPGSKWSLTIGGKTYLLTYENLIDQTKVVPEQIVNGKQLWNNAKFVFNIDSE